LIPPLFILAPLGCAAIPLLVLFIPKVISVRMLRNVKVVIPIVMVKTICAPQLITRKMAHHAPMERANVNKVNASKVILNWVVRMFLKIRIMIMISLKS